MKFWEFLKAYKYYRKYRWLIENKHAIGDENRAVLERLEKVLEGLRELADKNQEIEQE